MTVYDMQPCHQILCTLIDKQKRTMRCFRATEETWGKSLILDTPQLDPGQHRIDMCLCRGVCDFKLLEKANETSCSSTSFSLVKPTPFIPSSHSWQIVEEWHSLPTGMEVKLSLGNGQSNRIARIPNPWQQKFRLVSNDHKSKANTYNVDIWGHEQDLWGYLRLQLGKLEGIDVSCIHIPQEYTQPNSPDAFFIASRKTAIVYVDVDRRGSKACQCSGPSPC
eukprot:CAMPEP_0203751764 /NCGR_PEP_ID=MMETSP0098-20131031/5786_1 /ASSEMBLY_ACC=CAM_ASM_000208 /TAXON_ID=96639 /ORGANISM=" , Strain NY0313808BC1" /LENGTH=221 /DNA_ID=CAMNT_0050641637 /DNA_START=125 /DNA_END=787 /DNA_ORIENTATION=+